MTQHIVLQIEGLNDNQAPCNLLLQWLSNLATVNCLTVPGPLSTIELDSTSNALEVSTTIRKTRKRKTTANT